MTTEELVTLIKQVNREPVERDTLYNVITNFNDVNPLQVDPILN